MAKNLQKKLPSTDTIRVYDINATAVQKFVEESKATGSGAAVDVAGSVREASENAVSKA